MKNKEQLDRRSFLKLSAMASGGLLLGFNWSSCNSPNDVRPIKPMPENWYDINAFLKIGENGVVTIYSPNPEIGQNIKTSMPMIVAEELDVHWEDVRVEQAGLNTEWYTRQVAGGSQSIRQGWDSLRMAGATGRAMLVKAAADQWGISPEDCTVSEGIITNPSGEQLGFGDVAMAASEMEPFTEEETENIAIKSLEEFKIIGTDRGNVDIDGIITGKPLFGIDTKIEGMLHAAIIRPPAFGQVLDSYDASQALKVSGVKKVFDMKVPMRTSEVDGDRIVILAESTWAAFKGKKAIEAVWKTDSDLEQTADHKTGLADLLNETAEEPQRKDGDIEKAFEEADEVIERVFKAPFLPHNCLEPMNFFANVTEDKIELVGPIQTPAWTRGRVASMLDMLPEYDDQEEEISEEEQERREEEEKAILAKIDLQMTRMGGGFGRRLYGDFALEATQASKMAGVPVKLQWTREDDMTAGTYRPPSNYKFRAAIKDNKITGYHLTESMINSNMWNSISHYFPAGAIENYQVDSHQMESNITIGAWRAPVTNFLASAEQSFFDEIAEVINQDPVELRLSLLEDAKKIYDIHTELEEKYKPEETEDGEIDEADAEEKNKALEEAKEGILAKGNYEPERLMGVIKLAAEKANWGNAQEGVHQGFSSYYCHNSYVAQVAEVVMDNDVPKITKVICAVDCGIVVNPLAATNLIEGGIIDGIGHGMYGELTFKEGKPQSDNFNNYRLIRMPETPEIEVHFVKSDIAPTGLGEPTLPPAAGAVANALYRATGERIYEQPFVKSNKLLG